MESGDRGVVDHVARQKLAELQLRHESCKEQREEFEHMVRESLDDATKETRNLNRSMDQMNGGIKMLKGMIGLLMLLVAVGGLVVAIIKI